MGFDIQKLKQKFFHRESDFPNEEDFVEEAPYSAGDISYDDTDPAERAKTVKKKLVMAGVGAVAIFATASVASNVLFSSSGVEEKTQQQTGPTATVTAGTPADAFPAKYSEIAQTQGKQQTNGHNHATGSDMRNPQLDTTAQSTPVRVETVPAGSTPSAPVMQTIDPDAASRTQAAEKAAEQAAKERALIDGSALAFQIAKAIADGTPIAAIQPIGNAVANSTNTVQNISYTPPSPPVQNGGGGYVLNAGSVIQATLLTGVTSNVPNGDVVAQVRQDIYDSLTGQYLLIPQGSRLIGKTALAGGKRIGVVFQRIILPNGASLTLPDQQAIDGVGYPGLVDKYDDHRGSIYRAGFITALLGAGMQSLTGNTSGTDNRSPGEEAVSGAVASILRTGQQLIAKDVDAQPTIEITPGYQFSVFINQDLSIGAYEYSNE
jgi:conjugation trbI family protein